MNKENLGILWRRFLCWPGWTAWLKWPLWKKIGTWPGWTAWLKWPAWGKIGAWGGWKKLLFPHPVFVLLFTLVSGVGLPWVFLNGQENCVPAYLLYVIAAYALITLTAFLVKVLPQAKRRIEQDPLVQKLREKENGGAFGIGMYVEQFINFFYGGFKIVSGIVVGSAWIGADGIYNFFQSLIQLYQILRHKKTGDIKQQWEAYRQCGYMMIVLHLTMTGMVFQMIHMGRHEDATEISIIATAAFTFYKLINTFIAVARDRKHKQPVDSAVHFLDLSQALYNLFVLQVGLLWVFGGTEFAYQKLMNSLTGGAVCLLVVGMGIYMLWRAKRDMRKLEEKQIGEI